MLTTVIKTFALGVILLFFVDCSGQVDKLVTSKDTVTAISVTDPHSGPGNPYVEPLHTKYYKVVKVKPSELVPVVKSCLSTDGSVYAVDGVRMLVIRDYTRGHKNVASLLSNLGVDGTPDLDNAGPEKQPSLLQKK